MLRFTSKEPIGKVDVAIPYRETCDPELTAAYVECIRTVALAVGTARGTNIEADAEDVRWTKEFLIGFALLAVGEARSLLLLVSDNLNRHARVHLRSIYEYDLRAKLLLEDPKRAIVFRDSLAYEMRAIGKRLGGSMDALNLQIAEALGVPDASAVLGTKENAAFGGSVRDQMNDEIAPEKRYVGTFAWASQVSHGSILALRELAMAVNDAGEDLLSRAAADDKGNVLLHTTAWAILGFATRIAIQFGVTLPDVDRITKTLIRANARLGIVSPEAEAAAMRLREEHLKKRVKEQP